MVHLDEPQAWVAVHLPAVVSSSSPEALASACVAVGPALLWVPLQANEVQGVNEQVRLDVVIEGAVSGQARGEIDLEDVGLEVGIKENVEPEELKAVLPRPGIQDLLHPSLQLRLDSDERLDDGVVYSLPDRLHVYAQAFQMALERAQGPLVAVITLKHRLVLLKGLRFLVDAVVREMGVKVLLRPLRRAVVRLGRKPGQPLVVNVDPQGVDARQQDVNPQIELVVVDEEGVADVLADHRPLQLVVVGICGLLELAWIFYEVDAFPLRALGGLNDPAIVWLARIAC